MQLAAIWVRKHHLLKNSSINLGGKYFYSFEFEEGKEKHILKISRRENLKYIDKFYSDNSPNLSLVSAVVGKNGAGKSTVLDIIRRILKNNREFGGYANEYYEGVLVFEVENDEIAIKLDRYNEPYDLFYSDEEKKPFKKIDVQFSRNIISNQYQAETVYFSPFLDLNSFYFNFDNSPDIDISLNRLIQKDSEGEESQNQILNHKYKGLWRQFDFQSHSIAKQLHDAFNVPFFDKVELKIEIKNINPKQFHNTPDDFRDFYDVFYNKWRNELDDTERQITSKTPLESDKKLFELNFLRGIFSCLFAPLESSNRYLEEGKVAIRPSDLKPLTLKEGLIKFLENQKIIVGKNIKLPREETISLINEVTQILKGVKEKNKEFRSTETHSIILDFDRAKKILQKHWAFTSGLGFFTRTPSGFINISPSGIHQSSGEKAFLDLFSSLLFASKKIDKKISPIQFDIQEYQLPNHFLILLDEGDIGFHPVWKKKYVKTITNVLPKFFEKYEGVTVQIIFTSHDALTLSDIPNYNVVYLDELKVLEQEKDSNRPDKSFGANISSLLADSFFIDDGLVGEFAVEKIDKTIEWLDSEKTIKEGEIEYHKKVIDIIDEPIIKQKLYEMFTEKTGINTHEEEVIKEQIKRLQERLDDLNKNQ